jgi:glutamyl-Q tRNA(Asp) synthetase
MTNIPYVGRFAPSPSGPLHFGSLVAAVASYLDAKAHHGKWLLRIEDVDEARTVPGSAEMILRTLAILKMECDGEIITQSLRRDAYDAAFNALAMHVYGCSCSRREIADSRLGIAPDGSTIYPGTCRAGLADGKSPRAFRLRVPEPGDQDVCIQFEDRWQGKLTQNLATECGDFVLRRADGYWAYQLAVVVDDADQGVTHIVRGADLIDSTARQIYLQRLLNIDTPSYMHVPVVMNADGEKLSKQTGAQALDVARPVETLISAAQFLGLPITEARSIRDFWQQAIGSWADRFVLGGTEKKLQD